MVNFNEIKIAVCLQYYRDIYIYRKSSENLMNYMEKK